VKSLSRDGDRQAGRHTVLGLDPGTNKCGVAVVDTDGGVLHREIVSLEELPATVARLSEQFDIAEVAIGDRTASQAVRQRLGDANLDLPLTAVNEEMTSLLARQRYWQDQPPRGLARLIPLAWRVPPRPVDDYAAAIIAERLLKKHAQEP